MIAFLSFIQNIYYYVPTTFTVEGSGTIIVNLTEFLLSWSLLANEGRHNEQKNI